MSNYHTSVLLQETIALLNVQNGKRYIDATLGGGGHTGEILKLGGRVLGLDVDQDALDYVSEKYKNYEHLVLARGNFKDIDNLAKTNGFEDVAGILFDLGISSHHVDAPERGFSIQSEGPLDMRMDQLLSVNAKDLINGLTKAELVELFTRLGEEPFSRRIAEQIVQARKVHRIETTTELARIVSQSVPKLKTKVHPATRVFQAVRIAVNDELNSIREALPKAIDLLTPGGRVAVISFHSLEDRIVKNLFKEFEEKGFGKIITKKPIVPSDEEIETNGRSRSAKLRGFEKI